MGRRRTGTAAWAFLAFLSIAHIAGSTLTAGLAESRLQALVNTKIGDRVIASITAFGPAGDFRLNITFVSEGDPIANHEIDAVVSVVAALIGVRPDSLFDLLIQPAEWSAAMSCCRTDGGLVIAVDGTAIAGENITDNTMVWLASPAPGAPPRMELRQMPRGLLGATLYTLSSSEVLPAGANVSLFNSWGSVTSDVRVFLWHEPPTSSTRNGELPHTLLDSWDPGSCAPSFRTSSTPIGCAHRMTAFRRLLAPGENTYFKVSDQMDAQFVVIAALPASDCSLGQLQLNPDSAKSVCEASFGTCRWRDDTCIDDWCHVPNVPPVPGGWNAADCPPPQLQPPATAPPLPVFR
eukprot:TRINITY_DN35974_c1_g1_i1.p1 TRINITY_DN35974_c1_g1~~TRINITY_DN35974_c1_g1_i1.p1  ORF type:complete len:385 (+),score=108.32 TRINITY_DN35974_c1_g1_i1:108-1157(+)